MKLTDNIEKLIRDGRVLDVTTSEKMDQRIIGQAIKVHASLKIKPAQTGPYVWRTIMSSKITRFAAAAVIIIAVIFSMTLFDKTVTTAWALEDTIKLLANFNAIQCSGKMLDKNGNQISFQAWAKANKKQTGSSHSRVETEGGALDIVSGRKRYQYDPNTNVVEITRGYGLAMSPWLGADFFKKMKAFTLNWTETYGKDPATGKDRVFVTCNHPAAPDPRSWYFEFDVESKLPVVFKQWGNMDRRGVPNYEIESLTFTENLPVEFFNFTIPDGAIVINANDRKNKVLQDPNVGMLIHDLTEQQASKDIIRNYWQAVIDQDWQTVATLNPISTAEQWKDKYSGCDLAEIVKIEEPVSKDEYTLVRSILKNNQDQQVTIAAVIIFRTIDGQRSCVIANLWQK